MIDKTEQEIMKNWEGNPTSPIVSICVITYNHGPYIAEAIDSFLMQETDFPFEIVIRDDKSTDNTVSITKHYSEKYPQLIKVLDSSLNIGMNKNFRTVFDAAKGTYIALCEGDDFWCDKNKLQYQYKIACYNREIDFIIHACYSVRSDSTKLKQNKNRFFGNAEYQRFSYQDILSYSGQFAPTSSYFIKTSILKNLPIWLDEAPIGDIFLELYAAKSNGGIYLPEIMSCYRIESIGSWTDTMKQSLPQKKIEYAEQMIVAIENTKKDFPHESSSFDKKINALYFIMATAFLELSNFKKFQMFIKPKSGPYVSTYHKLLSFSSKNLIFSKIIMYIYKKIKILQSKQFRLKVK